MSDVLASAERVTLDQTYYLAAATSSTAQRLGSAVNLLNGQVMSYPIASVLQSILTEVQFQALRGTGWIISDGRSVVGSAYQTVTGNANVPDMRSTFLRGKNNGRADAFANPDGELALGAVQSSVFKSHIHGVTFSNNLGTTNGANDQSGFAQRLRGFPGPTAAISVTGVVGLTGITTASGDTRPRSITMNIFIRID